MGKAQSSSRHSKSKSTPNPNAIFNSKLSNEIREISGIKNQKINNFKNKISSLLTINPISDSQQKQKINFTNNQLNEISFENTSKKIKTSGSRPDSSSKSRKISKLIEISPRSPRSPRTCNNKRISLIESMGISPMGESVTMRNSAMKSSFLKKSQNNLQFNSPLNKNSTIVRKFTIINKEKQDDQNPFKIQIDNKNTLEKTENNSTNSKIFKRVNNISSGKSKSKSTNTNINIKKNDLYKKNNGGIKFESPLIRNENNSEKLLLGDYMASYFIDYIDNKKNFITKPTIELFKSSKKIASDNLMQKIKDLNKQTQLPKNFEFDLNDDRSGQFVDSNRFDNDLLFNKFGIIKNRVKFLSSHNHSDFQNNIIHKKNSFYENIMKKVLKKEEKISLEKNQENFLFHRTNPKGKINFKEKPIHIIKNNKELIIYKNKVIQLNDNSCKKEILTENQTLFSTITKMGVTPTEYLLNERDNKSP